jgi:hypothetical protein
MTRAIRLECDFAGPDHIIEGLAAFGNARQALWRRAGRRRQQPRPCGTTQDFRDDIRLAFVGVNSVCAVTHVTNDFHHRSTTFVLGLYAAQHA